MKLNYVVEGEGEPIVFIHGLSDSLDYWEPVASSLKENYKIIRMDLRGHGQSELGNDEITIDLFADDLFNILEELNLKKVNLVGFSLGGFVALDFAVNHPDMISSLVLMSCNVKMTDHSQMVFNKFLNAINSSFEDFYDVILPMVLCPDVIENHTEELELMRVYGAQTANVEAIKKAILAVNDFDIWDFLTEIDIPTLIIMGKYDEIFLPEDAADLSNQIKNSRLIVLDNLKHNLLVGKNVVKITDILDEFVKNKKK